MFIDFGPCGPGPVVKRGVSCSSDREFESQHQILDGSFFTLMRFRKMLYCVFELWKDRRPSWMANFFEKVSEQPSDREKERQREKDKDMSKRSAEREKVNRKWNCFWIHVWMSIWEFASRHKSYFLFYPGAKKILESLDRWRCKSFKEITVSFEEIMLFCFHETMLKV